MFQGTLRSELRPAVMEMVREYPGLPVFVGGSGNLTIERALVRAGVREIHGCGVALYPCAVGHYAAGIPLEVGVADPAYSWMEPYLDTPTRSIATLLLAQELLVFAGQDGPYHRRMYEAYVADWGRLHTGTVARVERALEGVQLASFEERDLVEFIRDAPEESMVVSYPPTYSGGYEKVFRHLHETFGWESPEYQEFDEGRFDELLQIMQTKRAWILVTDRLLEGMEPGAAAYSGPASLRRATYVYTSASAARVMLTRPRVEPVLHRRVEDELVGPLRVIPITGAQLNLLRSEYLGKDILTVSATWSFALLDGENRLIGALAFAFAPNRGGAMTQIYMLSDFSVRPTSYRRLSKLVVAAALSHEVQALLQERLCRKVDAIMTTAFTGKAESMKYRGLFQKAKKADGYVNYEARAGRWSLGGALEWWMHEHGRV